jgi:NO-binding membrane sensor protein with MHYT domain
LAGAAFSLAVAIWTMHFIGMLAARPPFQVDYLVFPTLLSFLVCVIVLGAICHPTGQRAGGGRRDLHLRCRHADRLDGALSQGQRHASHRRII